MIRIVVNDSVTGRHCVAWPKNSSANVVGRHLRGVLGVANQEHLVLGKVAAAGAGADAASAVAPVEGAAVAEASHEPLRAPLLPQDGGSDTGPGSRSTPPSPPNTSQPSAALFHLDELMLLPVHAEGATVAEFSSGPALRGMAFRADLSQSLGASRLRLLARWPTRSGSVTGSSVEGGHGGASADGGDGGRDGNAAAVLDGALAVLTVLDTTTTWCAAERVILNITRFLCQECGGVLKAIAAESIDTDDSGGRGDDGRSATTILQLRLATPLYFASLLSAFACACCAYSVYRRWLALPKERLAPQLFGTDREGRVAVARPAHALLASLTLCFALALLIKRLLL